MKFTTFMAGVLGVMSLCGMCIAVGMFIYFAIFPQVPDYVFTKAISMGLATFAMFVIATIFGTLSDR